MLIKIAAVASLCYQFETYFTIIAIKARTNLVSGNYLDPTLMHSLICFPFCGTFISL